jgi:hypothetical protein
MHTSHIKRRLRYILFLSLLAWASLIPAALRAQPIAGALDPEFNPTISGNSVNAIAVQADGKILVAGQFAGVNGQTHNSIAQFLPDGTIDPITSFNAGSGANGAINCIALQADGKILLGGDFTMFNGQPANGIVRLLPNGSREAASTFSIGNGANGLSIALSCNWTARFWWPAALRASTTEAWDASSG